MILKVLFSLWFCLFCLSDLMGAPRLRDFVVREAPPGSSHTAAYGVIENLDQSDDELLKVVSSQAKIEVHTTKVEDGLAMMSELPSVDIPSKGIVKFEPGKHHLMIMNLKTRLKKGDKLDLIFHFKKGGTVKTTATVKAL